MDVVYGIVLTYGAALAMPLFQSWFVGGDAAAGVRAMNIALVLNYAIADFIEARVVTSMVPYEGKARLSVDLLIAVAFLGALQAASGAREPHSFLIALAIAFFAGAIWAKLLQIEEKGRFQWKYSGCVVATHVVAGIICLVAYATMRMNNGLWFSFYLWFGYLIWLVIVTFVKKVAGVPETGFDLLPVSLVGLAVERLIRAVDSSGEPK